MKKTNVDYMDTTVKCSCGNTFVVKSNKEELHLEVCNECHPFYKGGTGTQVSKAGRVEKFNKKYGITKEAK